MAQFLARRLMLFIPMLFMMSVVSFLIILAPPGDFLNDYAAFLAERGEEVGPADIADEEGVTGEHRVWRCGVGGQIVDQDRD